MTERFSPEYIAFIRSDEAKVLQGRWPEHGDWVYVNGKARLVRGLDKQRAMALLGAAWYGIENLVWLPTLSDLLGMIEEAGQRWCGFKAHPDDSKEYIFHTFEGRHIATEKERLLAAAKLAVRVLEGKE